MAKRWTEREQRSKNLPTADGFNREYDSLRGWANAGVDRTSLPVSAITPPMVQQNAFCKVFVEDVEFGAPSRGGSADDPQFYGLTYEKYFGGFYPAVEVSLAGLHEGMMHLEFKCWVALLKVDDQMNPQFVEFRLKYNGQTVCEGGPCYMAATNYFLVCDFPIAGGDGTVAIEYRVAAPIDSTHATAVSSTDVPVMYYGGGQLLAIGRWR
jgi:hypothetical protein